MSKTELSFEQQETFLHWRQTSLIISLDKDSRRNPSNDRTYDTNNATLILSPVSEKISYKQLYRMKSDTCLSVSYLKIWKIDLENEWDTVAAVEHTLFCHPFSLFLPFISLLLFLTRYVITNKIYSVEEINVVTSKWWPLLNNKLIWLRSFSV